jgi:hypothetical protein
MPSLPDPPFGSDQFRRWLPGYEMRVRGKIDHEKADPRALVFRRRVQVRFTFNQGVSFSEHTLDPFRQTRISTLPDSLALSDFPSPIVVIRLSSNLKFCTM